MEVSYPRHIDVRNASFEKIATVFPQRFTCTFSLDGGSLDFSLPLSEDLIDIGSIVTYWWGFDFGGVITSRDINLAEKKVTYSGKSWRALLDNYIIEIGANDRTVTLESEISHPGCQTQLSGTTSGGIAYPNNGPYPLLHYIFEMYHLPFSVNSPEYLIALPANTVIRETVPLGTTLGGLVKIIENTYGYRVRITDAIHFFAPDRAINSSEILDFWLDAPETYEELNLTVPLIYDESKLIITETLNFNEMFDNSSLHYLASDDSYKTQLNVLGGQPPGANWPGDLKYTGIKQYSYWHPTSRPNSICQDELKSKRIKGGKLKSEITVPLRDAQKWGLFSLNLGDIVKYHLRTVDTQFEQTYTGRKLDLINGTPFITFILGG